MASAGVSRCSLPPSQVQMPGIHACSSHQGLRRRALLHQVGCRSLVHHMALLLLLLRKVLLLRLAGAGLSEAWGPCCLRGAT